MNVTISPLLSNVITRLIGNRRYACQHERLILKAALVVLLLFLPAATALAADINVDANCTLSEAITTANDGSTQTGCVTGSATLEDTIYITQAGTTNGTITLSAALPDITTVITINGGGFTVDGADTYQVFRITDPGGEDPPGHLTIENLTIANGKATDSVGGAIYVNGTLILNRSVVSSSSATGTTPNGSGGGIYVGSGKTATINNSTFSNNSAQGSGGGIHSASSSNLTISNSAFSDNSANTGGGLYAYQTNLTVTNSTWYNNSATDLGGGAFLAFAQNTHEVDIRHATFTGNTAPAESGGGIWAQSLGSFDLVNTILYGNTGYDCGLSQNAIVRNTGNLIGSGNCGTPAVSDNPNFGTPGGSPVYYPIPGDSPAVDAVACLSDVTTDQRGESRPQGSACDIGSYENVPPATPTPVAPTPVTPTPVAGPPAEQPVAGGKKEPAQRQAADAPVPKARLSTCLTLPASIVVSSIVNGTQCQQIGAAGIGIQEIIDAGFIDAVDVWGYLGPGVQVCFRGSGPLFFLDAANMPRSPEPMPAYGLDGMTCGIVSRPGSVVLVPGPAPAPLPPAAQELSGCMVTTTDILNFRASPNGSVMSQLPFNVTLTALSRTENWFEVDYHGESGWISADYVITEGACG